MEIYICYSLITDLFARAEYVMWGTYACFWQQQYEKERSSNEATEDWPIPSGSVHGCSLHILVVCVRASATAGKIHSTVWFLSLPPTANTLGLPKLSSLLGCREQTHTWQMCTVRCTSRAAVPGWGTCQKGARSSWTPRQCRQTQLAGQSITRGLKGEGHVLERWPRDKSRWVQPASRPSQHAREEYRAQSRTQPRHHGEVQSSSLKTKPLPSRAFLEAGSPRPERTTTWQRYQTALHGISHDHMQDDSEHWFLPSSPGNRRKTTVGHEPSSAQRKAENKPWTRSEKTWSWFSLYKYIHVKSLPHWPQFSHL